MKLGKSENIMMVALLLVILAGSSASISPASQSGLFITSTGSIKYFPSVDVTIDFSRVIGVNNLSLGANIGYNFDFAKWRKDSALRQKAVACNFRLIRIFVHEIQPATYWNETEKVGEYDWRLFDITIERILEIGAQPLLVVASGSDRSKYYLPEGMTGNYLGSKFPSNESFGTYAADLVRHVNIERGYNVKYWEIWNEPRFRDLNQTTGKEYVNMDRIANFTKTFNNAAWFMKKVDPSILAGHGYSAIKPFFDYFLEHAQNVGFFSFHDYDSGATEYFLPQYYRSEDEIMKCASYVGYQKPGIWKTYTPQELRQKWFERRGQQLQVLITETGMNSAFRNGTDPRLQTVFGAVWYAEKLRASIEANIDVSMYYVLASDHSPYWNTTELTKGWGFGMMNSTQPYAEWYPYWTNYLFGNHLRVGDEIYHSSTSNFTATSALAWVTDNRYSILLVGKTKSKVRVDITIENLGIISSAETSIYRVDEVKNGIQLETVNFSNPITTIINGYSIVILQISSYGGIQ